MNFLFEQRGGADLPQLAHQHKEAALAQVGLAAVRYIDTHEQKDFSILRMMVCRFQMYDRVAEEAMQLVEAGR